MGKNKIIIVDGNAPAGNAGTGFGYHARRLFKLLFSSYGILITTISLMALAVLNGDVFSDFSGGSITNLNDLLMSMGEQFAYPIAMLISAIILLGPLHYYATYNKMDIVVMLIIVFFFTGFVLGRMFRHPAWAFASGIVVMGSFIITFVTVMSVIDYASESILGIPIAVSPYIYAVVEGTFGTDIFSIFTFTIIENGLFLGTCGAFWGIVFMNGNKNEVLGVSFNCDAGKMCRV